MTAAEQYPEDSVPAAEPGDDDLQSAPTWIGDTAAVQRFGSPAEIRAALLAEQVAEFDAAFDAALTRPARRCASISYVTCCGCGGGRH